MSLQKVVDYITKNDNFLIASHVDPDGDATGSEFALAEILRLKGKNALILNGDKASSKFTFFDKTKIIGSLAEGRPTPENLANWNLIIVDTSDLGHTGSVKNQIIPFVKSVFIIDHHTAPKMNQSLTYIDESASATCEIMYLLYEACGLTPSLDAGRAIFTGIVYDTGSFIYPKTSARTFEVARKLTTLGVIPKEIHSELYETIEPARMKLLARVQSSMEMVFHNQIAWQVLTKAMLKETGASYEDSENFINYPLKCNTVRVSVFFKEMENGLYKCSLRSKGNIDVSSIAISLGGGGHRNAAGYTCPAEPLEASWNFLLESLENLILEDMKTS